MIERASMKMPILRMMKLPVVSSFGRVRCFSINRSAVSSERTRKRHGWTLCGDGAYLAVSSSVLHTLMAFSLADAAFCAYQKLSPPASNGLARKVFFTTLGFFSVTSAYLCDLCVTVVTRIFNAEIAEIRRDR